MKLPVYWICEGEHHCGNCRDREGHREWRARLADADPATFGHEADFACPMGKPWGTIAAPPRPAARRRGLGDWVAVLIAATVLRVFPWLHPRAGCGCEARRAWLNERGPIWLRRAAAIVVVAAIVASGGRVMF